MSASLLTVVVLSDGDAEGAERSVGSAKSIADEVLLWDRSELDWTETSVTRAALDLVTDDWILVLSAGETIRIADPSQVRSLLGSCGVEAIGVQAGLSAEVRIHRTNKNAMDGIGTPASAVSRELAIAPPEDPRSGQLPTISVIVATFNQPDRLRRCLESLCLQTTDDFEVVVVNDGGVDVSDVVDDFADLLAIRLNVRPLNGGPAATFNTGLMMARGRYALFQADHDTILPHHLALLRGALDTASADDTPVRVVFGPAFEVQETEAGKEVGRRLVSEGTHDADQLMLENFVTRGAAMFDRALARQIGGMDVDLEALADWDFWLRMSARGGINYIGTPTSECRVREDVPNAEAGPGFHESLRRLYEAHPVEADSQAAVRREQRLDAHRRREPATCQLDHTVAVVGDGDLKELGECLQSVMSAVEGAEIQLIVHELRSVASEKVLRELMHDATICLYVRHDESAILQRIERQAAGRCVTILSSSERLVPNAAAGSTLTHEKLDNGAVMLPKVVPDQLELWRASSWAAQQSAVTSDALYGPLSPRRRRALGSFSSGVDMEEILLLRAAEVRSADSPA